EQIDQVMTDGRHVLNHGINGLLIARHDGNACLKKTLTSLMREIHDKGWRKLKVLHGSLCYRDSTFCYRLCRLAQQQKPGAGSTANQQYHCQYDQLHDLAAAVGSAAFKFVIFCHSVLF